MGKVLESQAKAAVLKLGLRGARKTAKGERVQQQERTISAGAAARIRRKVQM
jgi:hypothetical protein